MTTAIALTFHRLENKADSYTDVVEPGARRYTVQAERFAEAIKQIKPELCTTAAELCENPRGNKVIISFDDGYTSDFEIALPALVSRGLRATFFITAANVDRRGYLNRRQIREMTGAGMEIGSHGLTHRYLLTMPAREAHMEIGDSKEQLEQVVGKPVVSFAPVGGHFRGWMRDTARSAGYQVFASMIPGITRKTRGFIVLRRNHILRDHSQSYIESIIRCDHKVLLANRLRYSFLRMPKIVLGLKNYDRFKRYLPAHR